MKAQDLKNSILQLAIQGKLVPQDPNDEPAEVLYAKIQAEKQKLIKEGKIKKDKPLLPITDDELPFEIPPSWKWVRLGDIAVINGGFAFKSTQYKDTGIRVIRISDFDESGFKNNKIVRYDYNDDLKPYIIEQSNILMAMTGGTVGKSYFIMDLPEPMVSNQRVATIKINEKICPNYINIVILAPVIQKLIQISKNSTNDNISMDLINNFIVPLPPLVEQKRIVAKIEELEPLIKQYDKAETELSDLNESFPEQLKKSILQYAIQGKLVPQDPNDETADILYAKIQAEKQKLIKEGKIKKDKPLPPITDDEIPFPIPSTWKWVRLSDIINNLTAGGDKPKVFSENKTEQNVYPVIANGKINDGVLGYTNEPVIKSKSITVSGRGTMGFVCIREANFVPIVRLLVLQINTLTDIKFLKYTIEALVGEGSGSAVQQLTVPMLKPLLVPLPPLAEQHRIVAKVNELMQYCEKLKL